MDCWDAKYYKLIKNNDFLTKIENNKIEQIRIKKSRKTKNFKWKALNIDKENVNIKMKQLFQR